MKIAILSLSLLTLIGISTSYQASSPKSVAPANGVTAPTSTICPVFVQPPQIVTDDTQVYRHCVKCGMGVYLPDKDNVEKCTVCGAIE